jgi:hypothetical protein
MRKTLSYLKDNFLLFLKGMAIGTAVIIPGVSGGTVAFMLGIYDRMIEAIVGLRRHFVKSLAYLTPILLGAMAAVLALIFPITWAFDHAPLPLVTLFAGLVIGSLPSLTSVIKHQASPWRFFILILSGLVAAGLGVLSVVTSFDASPIVNWGLQLSSLFSRAYRRIGFGGSRHLRIDVFARAWFLCPADDHDPRFLIDAGDRFIVQSHCPADRLGRVRIGTFNRIRINQPLDEILVGPIQIGDLFRHHRVHSARSLPFTITTKSWACTDSCLGGTSSSPLVY